MDTRSILVGLLVLAVLLAAMGVDIMVLRRGRQRAFAAISLILGIAVLGFYAIAYILSATIRSEFEAWTNRNQVITLVLIPLAYLVSIAMAVVGLLASGSR